MHVRILILLAGMLFLGTSGVIAQVDRGVPNERARSLVERALAAMGPEEVFESLESLRLVGAGTRTNLGQGRNPSEADGTNRLELEWLIDFDGERVFRRSETFQGEEGYFCFISVYDEDEGFNYECITGIHMPVPAEAAANARHALVARFPEPRGRLLAALEHAETLEYRGLDTGQTQAREVAAYTDDDSATWVLEFDPERAFLLRASSGETAMLLGTYGVVDEYSDYTAIGGIVVPMRVRSTRPIPGTIGWALTDDVRYDRVVPNAAVDGDLFEVPSGANPRRVDDEITVNDVAEGVFFLENVRPNYNQLVVEFEDFLLVVDAPYNSEIAMAAIGKIREVVPGKPIRYVVPTHFHYDHIGGLPAYAALGPRILSTPGNAVFFQDLVERSRVTEGGEPSREPVVVEEVRARYRVPGEGPVVELIDVGPNPHADELLVAYLPEAGILYVADVFSADWGQVRPAIPETFAFARTLATLGLTVETLLPGHGPSSSWDDFEAALAAGKEDSAH